MSEYDDAVVDLGAVRARKAAPQPGPPQTDEYDQAFDLMDQSAKQAGIGSVAGSLDANPDSAGKAMQLSGKIGVPAAAIETDLPAYEQQHHLQQSARIINGNPSLANWLSADAQRARVAKDDFEHLDFLSKLTRSWSTGLSEGVQTTIAARNQYKALWGGMKPDEELQAAEAQRSVEENPADGFYGVVNWVAQQAGALWNQGGQVGGGAAIGAVGGAGLGSAAGGVGALPGAAAGSLVGATGAFYADNFKIGAGQIYNDLSTVQDASGQHIDPLVAKSTAVAGGVLYAALATFGLGKLASGPYQSAVKAFARDAVKAAVARPTVQKAIAQGALELGKGAGGGAVLGTMIASSEILAEQTGRLISGLDLPTILNDPQQRQQALDQVVESAAAMAALGVTLHTIPATARVLEGSLKAKEAAADTAAFQGLEAGTLDSKTRGRSLDAFQSFMRGQTDGTPVENLAITSEAVRTLYQSAGREPGPGDGLLGDIVPDIREQLSQTAATGGDVIVPTAAYVSHLSGTPISEGLRQDIRFRPDGMTMREAEVYEKQRGEMLADLAVDQQTRAEAELGAQEPIRQVQADVEHKLRLAGQTADAAGQYAQLVAARYEARAARFEGAKGTAADLYKAEGLDIQRSVPETLRQVDRQDLLINSLRAGEKGTKQGDLFSDATRMDFDAAKADLASFMEAEGLDVKKASNEEIKSRLAAAVDKQNADAGREMLQGGAGKTDTPEFKAWFGDSKVVDAAGAPRVVYHGTAKKFPAFKKNKATMGGITWFTSDRSAIEKGEVGAQGKGHIFDLYASIKNPAGWKEYDQLGLGELKGRGYDGVILPESDGTFTGFVFEPTQLKSVENKGAFNPSDPRLMYQGERGKISLSDGRSTITLFKDADLSTFLHESGHLWLDEMARDAFDPLAPEALRADGKIIADWLKADDFSNLTTEQHEQFARGFETYLMEGRAPSAALASAFRKFKSWLTSIYKSLAGLNVPMSDEIRGVFDRMLASDEAIASWRQTEGLNPVFASAKDAKMTDAEFGAYQKGVEKARNRADEKMLRKTMAAIRQERTAEWKAEAQTVRDEVSKRVKARRDLNAVYFMRTGKLLDNPDAPVAEKVKISRAALEDMYGTTGAADALPNGILTSEGGTHPDVLADTFGFRTGDEMVKALMSLEASKRATEESTGKTLDGQKYVSHLIDAETRQTMLDRHGDALNDGSIEAEALASLHNIAQADVMAIETRAIARQAGTTALTLADINAWADNQIADMSTKRGTDMASFARLEAKYGKEAERALLKGDMEGAFKAKQTQLVNHVMARKAMEASEQYEKSMSMMRKLGKTPTRDTIQQSFMDQIHEVLDRLGLPTKRSETDAAATTPLREFQARMAGEGQDMFIPEFMLSDGWKADARDMNLGEFMEVSDAIKSLAHLGRAMREMEVDGERIKFAEIVDNMREVIGDRTRGPIGYSHAVTKSEKAWNAVLIARSGLRRMDTWALQMDRGNRNGPFTTYIVRPVYKALDAYRPEKSRRLGALWDILKPIRKELNQGKIDAPEIGYTFANKGELLHAIGHTGNESNFRKLLLGREWGEAGKDGALDATRWNDMVARLVGDGVLKKSDFDAVQKIWDLLEELKPGAQEAHKSIYGTRFNEITAQPLQTPFGEYRGGYMPAITDRLLSREGQLREDKAALNEQQTGAMFPTTGRGFTKNRVENYHEPLELNLSLIPSHIDSVLRFTHLQPTIRDVGRLMLKRSFKDTMRGVDPTVVSAMIVPWLNRTARQTQQIPASDMVGRLGDKALNTLRRRAGLQILAFNVVNTLQQLVGFAPGALKSSPGGMMRSLYTYARSPVETANRIAEASPFMDERMRSKSYEAIQSIQRSLEDTTSFDNVKHWGENNSHVMQQMAQNVVDITTWQAAYEHAAGKGETHADAVYAADAAVRETQGGFNPEDLSRFETGGALGRLFSHMYSYFGSQANLIGTEAALTRELGFKAGASRAAMVYIFGLMIPALVGEAIYRTARNGWGEDEDEGEMEGLASFFIGAQAKYLAPMVPIAGPIVTAAIDRGQGDRIGTSPSTSVVKQATRAPSEIAAALTGEKAPGAAVRDSMTALGLATGLPLGQAGKPLGYLADVATGWQEPETFGDVRTGLLTGRQENR